MITPRATRIIRALDLAAFRDAIAALACDGDPLDARDRLVLVPTRAAAAHLTRSLEDRAFASRDALLLPELVTRDELYARLASRLPGTPRLLNAFEREVLLALSCGEAGETGAPPPFRLRPGLVAEILAFYDALQRNQKGVDTFERLALATLEPGAEYDRGAERLVRQTRFLSAAFRGFEGRVMATGALDEHLLRRALLQAPPLRPWRHIVVTVRDRAADPHGLWAADFDLLARLPGLERIDVVVTEATLAGAFHERIHQLFPGAEEVRVAGAGKELAEPVLMIPADGGLLHVARDREEEVAGFARRVKRAVRDGSAPPLERVALVVRRPLPYVYVAREVLRSASIPCQMFDALPLAAEPFAAGLDLVVAFAASGFSRAAGIALLRSPHFAFVRESRPLSKKEIAALDRALSEAGYLGDAEALETLVRGWRGIKDGRGAPARGLRAAEALVDAARELTPLRDPAPASAHIDVLQAFVRRHETVPGPDDTLRTRHLRARAAILGALASLGAAHVVHDPSPKSFDDTAAMIRRWIESQTFAPRHGECGVHVLDADSARYGDFEMVQLAGLVEGEWPDRPRRNIFYSPGILRDLGWPAEADRIAGARDAFADLLHLSGSRLVASAFTLENDAIVSVSSFADAVEAAQLPTVEEPAGDAVRIFEFEALGLSPPRVDILSDEARAWAALRLNVPGRNDPRYRGATDGHAAPAYSVSSLERYQDCPFKFFAADVLRLEEPPEDEPLLSPRARGRFVHEVFQRFFEAWDREGNGTITAERLDSARQVFAEAAEPLLARLPEAEASLERARLFGSAIAVGLVDVVLGLEASRPVRVRERLLEYQLDGEFGLGHPDGRRASLRGVADRIDLLEDGRLRVIDYKSGYAPNVKRALQVPVYALCASERLAARDGRPWHIEEAAYVAFSGKRSLVPVVRPGTADPAAVLNAARDRLFEALDGVGRGEFPPRPHDPAICGYCAYASVCRKDYVGDE